MYTLAECTTSLKLHQSNLLAKDWKDLIAKLLEHPGSVAAHFRFLLVKVDHERESGIAAAASCDLSGMQLSSFLAKRDFDNTLLQELLRCGVTPTFEDIENAVSFFRNDEASLTMIKVILSHLGTLQPTSLDRLCNHSIKQRKDCFVAHFISCGANPDVNFMLESMNWKQPNENLLLSATKVVSCHDRTTMFKEVLRHNITLAHKVLECGEINYELLDLGSLMESSSLPTDPGLMEKLLTSGASPNGLPDTQLHPIDAVFYSLKQHDPKRKAMLVHTLVNYGANLSQACHPRKEGTTVIHKATELAISTGIH